MTEVIEPSPAERITAWIASQGGSAPPPAAPPGASAGADPPPEYVTQWGAVDSPMDALGALEADPSFMTALYDNQHPGHRAALAAKTKLFQQILRRRAARTCGGQQRSEHRAAQRWQLCVVGAAV